MSECMPGQFAMVWIPGTGELPMSIMTAPGRGRAAFTVRRHGPSSTALYDRCVGEQIGVRGPYGNSFDVREGRIMLVGGGTGLVPLMRLLGSFGEGHDVTFLLGSRTRSEVLFENAARLALRSVRHRIIVTTDDGSYGQRGLATDAAASLLEQDSFDAVYTCGPEPMMYGIVRAASAASVFVQASLERMMKCGVGICGSCCMDSDLVCRDGTVFNGVHLLSSHEFGCTFRNKAGALESY